MRTSFFKHLNLSLAFFALLISCGRIIYSQAFSVSAVNDMVRVFEDGYNLPPMKDSMKLFGIRGEILSGQFVINAKNPVSGVSVEIGQLKNKANGDILPLNVLEWNFVGSVPLVKNAPNQPPGAVTRQAPARFPDYLMAERQINITKGIYQPVYLTIRVPDNAAAGTYTGNLIVKSSKDEQSLPLFITIYPLTIPLERHLKIAERFTIGNFAKYHGIKEMYSKEWFDMLKIYAENMVDHRQNVMQVPFNSIDIRLLKNGELEFDFIRFDQIAQVFWDTEKMDYIETGYGITKFGEEGWFSRDILLNDFTVKNPETGEQLVLPGNQVVPSLLPAFERHLRQKGWLEKTLFSVKNEPSLRNAIPYCDLSDYFHQLAPDLKQFESLETPMFGGVEIVGPKIDHLASWYETYKKAQQRGVEVCYYIVGIYQGSRYPNKTIDVPLMDNRIMPWINYKYDLSGIKHWGWNQWTGNPYQEVGIHIGDGWHVYPLNGGILNSLRWEQMRNGIQEYEYFRLLEKKIEALKDSLGSRFLWIEPKQRGKEICAEVVTNFLERTDNPEVLYMAKKQLLNEIVQFDSTPRLYIQTDPMVKSVLTERSSVAVYGWTDPGNKITVNGQECPVSKEGLILEQLLMSKAENKIVVRAIRGNESREVERQFIIE